MRLQTSLLSFVVCSALVSAWVEDGSPDVDLDKMSAWDKDSEPEEVENMYLYHDEDSWPIVDFDGDYWPGFLYAKENGPRVVEFYAPWCPFCQAFREHYIQFARVVNEIIKEIDGPPISWYAVSCGANRPICQDFGIQGFPQIRLFKAHSTKIAGKIKYYSLHPFDVLELLGVKQDLKLGPETHQLVAKLQTHHKKKGDLSFPPRSKQDVFDDAYLSFDFMLRHSVYLKKGPVDIERKVKLHLFMELLKGFVPPHWRLAKYLRALLDNFEQVTNKESLMLVVADKFPPPKKQWSYSCTKGVPGMGYSCGLWQLLHMYTVGMIEWNSLLDETQEKMLITPNMAADVLRDFIEGFLDCEVCRTNFIKSYDSCAFDRCNRLSDDGAIEHLIQFPLWLWETHNAVNQRLLKERGEREGWVATKKDELKRRWPSRVQCPMCWNRDGSWDEDMIYKFLRIEYWPEDSLTEDWRVDIMGNVDITKLEQEEQDDDDDDVGDDKENDNDNDTDNVKDNGKKELVAAAETGEQDADVESADDESSDKDSVEVMVGNADAVQGVVVGGDEDDSSSSSSSSSSSRRMAVKEKKIIGKNSTTTNDDSGDKNMAESSSDGDESPMQTTTTKDDNILVLEFLAVASTVLGIACFGFLLRGRRRTVQRHRSGLHKKIDV